MNKSLCGVLFVLGILASASAAPLTRSQLSKLNPAFHSIAAEQGPVFTGDARFVIDGVPQQEVGVIIYTSDADALRAAGIAVQSVFHDFVTARIRTRDVTTLASIASVQYVDPGTIVTPLTDVSVPMSGAPLLHRGFFSGTTYTGKGSIVLIEDTGIDFRHLDFRNPEDTTKSRILAIWDQTLQKTGTEVNPQGFTYGVEYTKEQIEKELTGAPPGYVRQKDTDGHGTHVTGTAAGNGLSSGGKFKGVAPEADIIVIKSIFSSPHLIDGLHYAELAAAKYGKPVAVNWSIGSHEGTHDGTNPEELAVDEFVKTPGRVVSISAGNSGNKNCHITGTIPPSGTDTIRITVPEFTPYKGDYNDVVYLVFYLPYSASTQVSAMLISPSGIVTGTAWQMKKDSTDGVATLSSLITIDKRYSTVRVSVDDINGNNPRPGVWKLMISNTSTSPIMYHGWGVGTNVGGKNVMIDRGDNVYTVSIPATSRSAITVGAYISRWGWPSVIGQIVSSAPEEPVGDLTTYSSQGPTLDQRQKPDIAAPGANVAAALSPDSKYPAWPKYILPGGRYYINSGTSMAAPHVTGACALLLSMNPGLTSDRIKEILQASALKDRFTEARSGNFWGAGKLDIARAAAMVLSSSSTFSRSMLQYDSGFVSTDLSLSGSMKAAIRLTPAQSGALTQAVIRTVPSADGTVSAKGDFMLHLYADAGGAPGAQIGSAVRLHCSTLNAGTYNYIPLIGAGMMVEKNREYFFTLSLADTCDTLAIQSDKAVPTAHSLLYDGGGWKAAANNLRIRAELASYDNVTAVVDGGSIVPQTFSLEQNYPNPFNPSTSIGYSLPAKSHVTLTISDMLGKVVATLVKGEEEAGFHRVTWNGRTSAGFNAASGMYFYRIESNGRQLCRKMLLVK